MSETKQASSGAAQMIFEELRATREAVATLEKLAEIVAAPNESGESFLQLMLDTQSRLVAGLAEVQASVQALHRAITEPGIATMLRHAISED